jgi:hypothetical protein
MWNPGGGTTTAEPSVGGGVAVSLGVGGVPVPVVVSLGDGVVAAVDVVDEPASFIATCTDAGSLHAEIAKDESATPMADR